MSRNEWKGLLCFGQETSGLDLSLVGSNPGRVSTQVFPQQGRVRWNPFGAGWLATKLVEEEKQADCPRLPCWIFMFRTVTQVAHDRVRTHAGLLL
jgi:hypothetical protein